MSIMSMPGRGVLRRRRLSLQQAGEPVSLKDRARRGAARAGVLGVLVTLLLGLFMALGASLANAAPSEEDPSDYSMYKLSSSVSTYFGNSQSPEEDVEPISPHWDIISNNAANGGTFLGYPDSDKSGLLKWLTSQISGSSAKYSYTSFAEGNVAVEDSDGANTAMLNYAYFGAANNALGLDGTSTSLSFGGLRTFAGGVILVSFVLAAVADGMFWLVLKVMQFLNPFALFYNAIAATSPNLSDMIGGDAITPTVDIGGMSMPHPLYGLASWIGGWYSALYQLSWALVPIFLGVLIFSVMMFRKADHGGKIKRFLVRLGFLVLGVPVLGGLYTGSLNALADMSGGTGSLGATKVVLSTYVDFERWATVNRLAVPTEKEGYDCTAIITWQGSSGEPDGRARAGLRNTALCINSTTGAYGDPGEIISSGDNTGSVSGQWDTQDTQEGPVDDIPGGPSGPGGPTTTSAPVVNTINLLGRYITGSQVSASDFETSIQSNLTARMTDGTSSEEEVRKWFLAYADDSKLGEDLDPSPADNPVLTVADGKGLQVDLTNYPDFASASGTKIKCGYEVVDRNCNMSAMAMYNYLNTSFGDRTMTVYSSEKSSSGAIREIHNSVNQIGSGPMGFLYWFNAVVMLWTFVLIALTYLLAMIIGNLKRTIQAISSIPFAMLGAVNSIAKVIVYGVAMVVELLGTIFIYIVMQELLLSLPQILEAPMAQLLDNDVAAVGAAGAAIASAGWLSMAILIITTIFMIWFTIMALKVRKGFISAVNEAVTKAVEKFTDGQVMPPTPRGPGMAGAMAGNVASMAGMAAAGKAMSGKGPDAGGSGAGAKGIESPGDDGSGGGFMGGMARDGSNAEGIDGSSMGEKGLLEGPSAGGLMGGSKDQLAIEAGPSAGGAGGAGTGGTGDGGSGGEGADGTPMLDENGNEVIDQDGNGVRIDDDGNPISPAGEAPSASQALAGSENDDRYLASGVMQQGGLSTNDDAPAAGSTVDDRDVTNVGDTGAAAGSGGTVATSGDSDADDSSQGGTALQQGVAVADDASPKDSSTSGTSVTNVDDRDDERTLAGERPVKDNVDGGADGTAAGIAAAAGTAAKTGSKDALKKAAKDGIASSATQGSTGQGGTTSAPSKGQSPAGEGKGAQRTKATPTRRRDATGTVAGSGSSTTSNPAGSQGGTGDTSKTASAAGKTAGKAAEVAAGMTATTTGLAAGAQAAQGAATVGGTAAVAGGAAGAAGAAAGAAGAAASGATTSSQEAAASQPVAQGGTQAPVSSGTAGLSDQTPQDDGHQATPAAPAVGGAAAGEPAQGDTCSAPVAGQTQVAPAGQAGLAAADNTQTPATVQSTVVDTGVPNQAPVAGAAAAGAAGAAAIAADGTPAGQAPAGQAPAETQGGTQAPLASGQDGTSRQAVPAAGTGTTQQDGAGAPVTGAAAGAAGLAGAAAGRQVPQGTTPQGTTPQGSTQPAQEPQRGTGTPASTTVPAAETVAPGSTGPATTAAAAGAAGLVAGASGAAASRPAAGQAPSSTGSAGQGEERAAGTAPTAPTAPTTPTAGQPQGREQAASQQPVTPVRQATSMPAQQASTPVIPVVPIPARGGDGRQAPAAAPQAPAQPQGEPQAGSGQQRARQEPPASRAQQRQESAGQYQRPQGEPAGSVAASMVIPSVVVSSHTDRPSGPRPAGSSPRSTGSRGARSSVNVQTPISMGRPQPQPSAPGQGSAPAQPRQAPGAGAEQARGQQARAQGAAAGAASPRRSQEQGTGRRSVRGAKDSAKRYLRSEESRAMKQMLMWSALQTRQQMKAEKRRNKKRRI